VASTGNGRLAIDGPSTFVTLKSSPKKEQKVIHKRLQMKIIIPTKAKFSQVDSLHPKPFQLVTQKFSSNKKEFLNKK
jgi:hypothetical protein